jgi:hypothetical protein
VSRWILLIGPPLVYAVLAFAISKGGIRMRDGRVLGRRTTPGSYWTFMVVGAIWAGTFFVVSLVLLIRGEPW